MMKRGKNFFKKINWGIFFLSLITTFAVAVLGSLFTSVGVKSFWYLTVRPSLTPPNWVFSVVWSILFLLIALSLYLVLTNAKTKKINSKMEIFFGINFILNFLWTFFYFGLRNPLLGFIDLILLWLSIFALIFVTWKVNHKASLILIPYFLWVTFAGILNYLSI